MSDFKNRINGFHKWALLLCAASMDFLQIFLTFIPFVGPFLASAFGILGRLVFWVWFRVLGVGFADKTNRLVINISMTVVEFLPLLNALPAWTIGTLAIIAQVKAEDALHNLQVEKDMEVKATNDNTSQGRLRKAA